jgi:hypothetical protein
MLCGTTTFASAQQIPGLENSTISAYGDFELGFLGVKNKDFGVENDDQFTPAQRFRLFMDYIASDKLRASFGVEVNQDWGDNNEASVGGDNEDLVEIKRAMLEFRWPETSTRVRGGVQPVELPSVAMGANPVLTGDMAALTMSTPIGTSHELTLGWSRGYEDTSQVAAPGLDSVYTDLSLRGDGYRFSPFAVTTIVGQDMNATLLGEDGRKGFNTPANGAPTDLQDSALAWWGGISFDIDRLDPFRLYGSAIYGSLNTDQEKKDRSGYYTDLALEYRLPSMRPEIFGVYASGEDGSADDGSETMPMIYNDEGTSKSPSMLVGDNTFLGSTGGGVALLQSAPLGLWSVGVSLKDITLMEKLSGTMTMAYYRGTNDPDLESQELENTDNALTEDDSAYEITLQNKYELYESLSAILETGYARRLLDDRESPSDAYRYGVGLNYSF